MRFVILALFLSFAPQIVRAQEKSDPHRFLTLWAGMLPIILSAPHGGRQSLPGIAPRNGYGVPQFITERDGNTAELAEKTAFELQNKLKIKPYLIVALFHRKYLDANRPRERAYESEAARPYYDAYHRAIEQWCAQVRREWGRGLLLDFHGQGSESESIFRGTVNGKSVSFLKRQFGREALTGEKSILGHMERKGYKIIPSTLEGDRERRYRGGYTAQTYGSHRGTRIDIIQLEFGTSLRRLARLEQTASDLADAIVIFAREFLPAVKLPALSPESAAP